MMLTAELGQVAGSRGAAVFPRLEVICFVVGRAVGAAGERAFAVAQPDPAFDGFGEPVVLPADFQGRTVPGVHEDPVERLRPVRNEPAGHGRRDWSKTVQDGWFVSGSE